MLSFTSVLVHRHFLPYIRFTEHPCSTDTPRHTGTNIPKHGPGKSQEMTTRVNGDPLRLIQEGLEGFLHSLSKKMDSRKRMLLSFGENPFEFLSSNCNYTM